MKKILVLIILVIFALLLGSCSDEPTNIGIDLVDRDLISIKTFDTRDSSIFQTSSYFKEVVPLGFSSKILIGKRDSITASTLMKFLFFVDDSMRQDFLDGNIVVNEAFIKLTPAYTFAAADTTANMDFTVHKINTGWAASSFTIDSLASLDYDQQDLVTSREFTDSLYTVGLDAGLINSWIINSIDSTMESNYGIYCKPVESSAKIVGFEALTTTSTEAVKISVVIEKAGSYVDTIKGFIFLDVSVVDAPVPVLPQGEIGVQGSVSIQSKIFFDLSGIPHDIIVNNAELFITADTINSITGTPFNGNLKVYKVTDSTDNSTEGNGILIARVGDTYQGNITGLLNEWISTGNNQGLIIKPVEVDEGLELFALKGSDYPDSTQRPRLRIIYTQRNK